MFQKEIPVLLVDDEPDVLAVTKLALRDCRVDGLPLKLYTAASKAEAIELFDTALSHADQINPAIAVAFIDVVMETDTAGLELCEYIREELAKPAMQIFIRTGHPGVAPEREVIDRYEINGYFTKVETTEDKLYSLVRSGVRQAYSMSLPLALSDALDSLITVSESREAMAQAQLETLERWRVDFKNGLILDGKVITYGWDEQELRTMREHMDQLESNPLSPGGDKWAVDGNDLYIKVAASPTTSEAHYLTSPYAPLPEWCIVLLYKYVRSVAKLWQKAAG
jgi:CheY-like chemotaxis protein